MRQIFFLFLLFIVGQWFVKALRRAQTHTRAGTGQQTANGGPRASARPSSLPEPMVRCAECGVHAPRSESMAAMGQSFCCDQHAHQYAARATGQDQDRAAR
jgi:uncharacterized protein